ncbi:MAG: nucleotidyl transferase AbiEii/AbiGii toxin family protein [Bacteroidota bacterium]
MTGLAPKTLAIFDAVSSLYCIQNFVLVGGTGMALQINHRLSEDLDFCKWVPVSNAANGIDIKTIEVELKNKFSEVKTNPLSFDQVDFYARGVKLSFFNEVGYTKPDFEPIKLKENLLSAPLGVIGSMKIKTMFERNVFRDYYDVFVLLKEGVVTIDQLIESSVRYHSKLKKQMIINRLQRWEQVANEKGFAFLKPKYDASAREIGEFLIKLTSQG